MAIRLKDALAAYGAAWLEPSLAKRIEILKTCWNDDGLYLDPNSIVRGIEELAKHIGGFHSAMPGARIELTSGASEHNSRIYFKWQLISANGDVAIEGVDFGALSSDGRIREIVGFFGSPPSNV